MIKGDKRGKQNRTCSAFSIFHLILVGESFFGKIRRKNFYTIMQKTNRGFKHTDCVMWFLGCIPRRSLRQRFCSFSPFPANGQHCRLSREFLRSAFFLSLADSLVIGAYFIFYRFREGRLEKNTMQQPDSRSYYRVADSMIQ